MPFLKDFPTDTVILAEEDAWKDYLDRVQDNFDELSRKVIIEKHEWPITRRTGESASCFNDKIGISRAVMASVQSLDLNVSIQLQTIARRVQGFGIRTRNSASVPTADLHACINGFHRHGMLGFPTEACSAKGTLTLEPTTPCVATFRIENERIIATDPNTGEEKPVPLIKPEESSTDTQPPGPGTQESISNMPSTDLPSTAEDTPGPTAVVQDSTVAGQDVQSPTHLHVPTAPQHHCSGALGFWYTVM